MSEATSRSTAAAAPPPLRSVHTPSFPLLLQELGLSILVSTDQAGKLVLLRADEGVLNTHFRTISKPMGLAANRNPSFRMVALFPQPFLIAKLDSLTQVPPSGKTIKFLSH
jgi:hypothetical protein